MNYMVRRPKDVGHALREARKQQGLTQTQLASLSGVRQETISKVENGIAGTKLVTFFALLGALDLEATIRDRTRGSAAAFEDMF